MRNLGVGLFLLGLVGCDNAAGQSSHTPAPPASPPPASLAVAEPSPAEPKRPTAKAEPPRIMAGVEVKPVKKDPKGGKDIKTGHPLPEAKFQIYFPPGAVLPQAGEYADVLGPKGYRFKARVAYVKEEQRYQPNGRAPRGSGVGHYATLFAMEDLPSGFAPKGEALIAMIPADEARKNAQPIEAEPDPASIPGAPEKAKVSSFADVDGDGAVDALTLSAPADCRLSFALVGGAWSETRRFCGKLPEQVRVSSYSKPKEDAKVEVIR